MELISNIGNEDFNNNILPSLVYRALCTNYNLCVRDKRLIPMNEYLVKNYDITIKELLDAINGNIVANNRGNQCVIFINSNVLVKDKQLGGLLRLVDNGNLEIKGVHLFDSSFNYVGNRIDTFYNYYKIGGFNK